MQRLVDDLAHLVDPPALAERGEVVPDAGDLLVVGTVHAEHELRVRRLDEITAVDQPVPVERPAERQGAGLGDDGLVQVEERDAAAHGRQV